MSNRFLFIDKVSTSSYNLRDIGPAGGLIFYINPNASTDGWTYLESALGAIPPYTGETLVNDYSNVQLACGASGTTVGSGLDNTLRIINQSGFTDGCALNCYNFEFNGYTDWFLPSKDELDYMYDNLKSYGVGYFTDISYWSSSCANDTQSWRQTFSTGAQSLQTKNTTYRFRAIRKF
jgi:hypothetical protein